MKPISIDKLVRHIRLQFEQIRRIIFVDTIQGIFWAFDAFSIRLLLFSNKRKAHLMDIQINPLLYCDIHRRDS
jgi:hypothetical protein